MENTDAGFKLSFWDGEFLLFISDSSAMAKSKVFLFNLEIICPLFRGMYSET